MKGQPRDACNNCKADAMEGNFSIQTLKIDTYATM